MSETVKLSKDIVKETEVFFYRARMMTEHLRDALESTSSLPEDVKSAARASKSELLRKAEALFDQDFVLQSDVVRGHVVASIADHLDHLGSSEYQRLTKYFQNPSYRQVPENREWVHALLRRCANVGDKT